MKRWSSVLWLVAASAFASGRASPAVPTETLHRMLGIALDVASDAEGDGLDEVREKLVPLSELAAQLGPEDQGLKRKTAAIAAAARRGSVARVEHAAKLLVSALEKDARVVTAPSRPPDVGQGRAVYAQACAACHGPDGRSQTAAAEAMEPRPADLTDAEMKEKFSAYRVYNVVRFGVPNTPMPGFTTLTDDERWAVAAYVLSLSHGGAPEQAHR